MQNENFFSIAELDIKICFAESPFNGMHLIPSLEPFRDKNLKGELFFQLSVDDTLSPYPKEKRKRIRAFDTGNGNTIVDKLDNGGYQYIIKDIQGANCCLLLTNAKIRTQQCPDAHLCLCRKQDRNTLAACITCKAKRIWLCLHCQERNGKEYTGEHVAALSVGVRLDERRQPYPTNHRRYTLYIW